ncbi:MAG: 3-deoxy-7-phosphoheptulonate synthase [Cyanobacteriota bacterium]
MLIVMKANAENKQVDNVVSLVKQFGFEVHLSVGKTNTVIGLVGENTSKVDARVFELLDGVREVIKISSPYKLASRAFKVENTKVKIKENLIIGNKELIIMAGPCAVETKQCLETTARSVKKSGAQVLRGGAFKPRTSPYAFQGLGEEGLKYLKEVADEIGMAVISEVMEINQIELFMEYVDILQVGARNMQNFNLLKELGQVRKPVLLKRGLSATVKELLMSAEYLLAGGNNQVILCERGIRTFEDSTRNTLDLSAIPVIKSLSHLPVVVDPSHATGLRDKVAPMARASVAAGADGLLIEVHCDPTTARCDGAQSLYPEQFDELMKELKIISEAVGKTLSSAGVAGSI